jgi:hypothetical protein
MRKKCKNKKFNFFLFLQRILAEGNYALNSSYENIFVNGYANLIWHFICYFFLYVFTKKRENSHLTILMTAIYTEVLWDP